MGSPVVYEMENSLTGVWGWINNQRNVPADRHNQGRRQELVQGLKLDSKLLLPGDGFVVA